MDVKRLGQKTELRTKATGTKRDAAMLLLLLLLRRLLTHAVNFCAF